jgi:hypothetical protein
MLDIFKRVFTFFRKRRVQTDSFVFRLHHSATVALLLIFCLIVGLNQYMKSSVKCSSSEFALDVLDAHFWAQCTVVEPFQKKEFGPQITHPGVAPLEDEESVRSIHYYYWVYLCLFFQVSKRTGSVSVTEMTFKVKFQQETC